MKGMKILFVVLFALALTFSSVYAETDEGGKACGSECSGKKEGPMAEVMKELGLTSEQQDKLKEIRTQQKAIGKEIREQTKAKRDEMKAELNKSQSDESKLNQLVGDITDLHRKKVQQRVDGVLGMKKVLTPEQFQVINKKMESKRKDFEGKNKGRRGKKGHTEE